MFGVCQDMMKNNYISINKGACLSRIFRKNRTHKNCPNLLIYCINRLSEKVLGVNTYSLNSRTNVYLDSCYILAKNREL